MVSRIAHRCIVRIVLAGLVLQATPMAACADLVILRTGEELKGTVVDREQLAVHPGACTEVRIVVDSASDLLAASSVTHVPAEDIQYVVLENFGLRHLVVFAPTSVTPRPIRWGSTEVRDRGNARRTGGVLLTGLGLASFSVGVILKAAEVSTVVVVVGFDGMATTGKSHDGTALTLIGAGGAAVIAGVLLISTSSTPRGESPRVTAYNGEAGEFGAQVVLYRH
jgi:hypothetical protein